MSLIVPPPKKASWWATRSQRALSSLEPARLAEKSICLFGQGSKGPMMNITPAAYPLPPHQQSPYGFTPSPVQRGGSAFQSHPPQQYQQQHVSPQVFHQPTNISPQGYPSQPVVRPPQANAYAHPSTALGNGPVAPMSQPGLQQHVEGK